ncbi:hypothetical protein GQ457_13G026450 [Hibiscus cannabinus]
MSLKPFLHQHHLVYDEYEKQEACCAQCNLQIDGWAFSCEICKFWLHHSCAVKSHIISILNTLLHWSTTNTISLLSISFVMGVPVLLEDACTGV